MNHTKNSLNYKKINQKTIYIHIGTPKTRTTSIQKFLTKNIKILSKEGIYYPLEGRYSLMINNKYREDYKNLNYCANGGIINNKNKLKDVLKNFDKSKKNKMILSEESLFLQNEYNRPFNNEEIWNLLSNYEIKIIIYFRRSVNYLCSLWQEYMKLSYQTDLLNFLESYNHLKYLNNFHNLSKRVGGKNIIVRTFEKEAWPNNSLIEDFLSILKINNFKKFRQDESFENIGISREECDKLLYINRHLRKRKWFLNQLKVEIKIATSDNHIKVIDSLSDEIIKKITNKYYQEECKIAHIFLNREELFQSKFPKIYKKSRPEYKKQISNEDKKKLRFIVNSNFLKLLKTNLKTIIKLIIKKIIDKIYINFYIFRSWFFKKLFNLIR